MNILARNILLFLLYICGSTSNIALASEKLPDPFERINRITFNVNLYLDRYFLRPTTALYEEVTPQFIRTGFINIYNNLYTPISVISLLLQQENAQATDAVRTLLVNSTLGLGGFYDVASELSIEPPPTITFESVLEYWDVPHGPYVVLPLFGSRTMRNCVVLPIDYVLLSIYLTSDLVGAGIIAIETIEERAALLPFDNFVYRSADPYHAVYEAYSRTLHEVSEDEEVNDLFLDDEEF